MAKHSIMKKLGVVFSLLLLSSAVNGQNFGDAGSRKITAIDRVVHLNNNQRVVIKKAYQTLLSVQDSAINKVADYERSFQIIYDAKRQFHEKIVGVLTTSQLVAYVKAAYRPEINAKTAYYCSLLESTGKYDGAAMTEYKEKIAEHLMLEKIVYVREKYDYAKQKNNISRLKALQPICLKEALNLEKQNGLNKLRNGKISW